MDNERKEMIYFFLQYLNGYKLERFGTNFLYFFLFGEIEK
jgi:hypothetical protein